jgi:hypothetical protein
MSLNQYLRLLTHYSLDVRDLGPSWPPIVTTFLGPFMYWFQQIGDETTWVKSQLPPLLSYWARHCQLSQASLSQVDCFSELYGRRLFFITQCILCSQKLFVLCGKQTFMLLCTSWGYFVFLTLAFLQFLEANRGFTLDVDSDVCDCFVATKQSRTSQLYLLSSLL